VIKHLLAIAFIFVCTSIAWMILGGTIYTRTTASNSSLKGRVVSTWGSDQQQKPPEASFKRPEVRKVVTEKDGKKIEEERTVMVPVLLPLERTRANAQIDLEHRRKGLMWYSTYGVAFAGDWSFENTSNTGQDVTFRLDFPATQAIYDGLAVTVDGRPVPFENSEKCLTARVFVPSAAKPVLHVEYRSRGLNEWRYAFGDGVAQVRDFQLQVKTNFDAIDFADNTLSPSKKQRAGTGWLLTWDYSNLVSGYPIALLMPEKLQPGPLAGQISLFAPVSLLFFFFVLWLLSAMRGVRLHPMNYFFLAAAFFAFHLLLAYLVDLIDVHAAFFISAAVSMFLVVSYLRLVAGLRFAAVEAGIAQFVYLVMFSYAFFFEGLTGLTITIGAILTLFIAMQLTGRYRWEERFTPVTAS
jgi:inner membrane protein involved in colicin E2 resistance